MKFNDALVREGDKFDYFEWLQRVRTQEARSKKCPAACAPRELAATEICNQAETPGYSNASPNSPVPLNVRAIRKIFWQADRASRRKTSQSHIRRRLEEGREAWDEFQATRVRDSVYGYLEAVFAIVGHYKVRRKTNKLLRHAFNFVELAFDKNANPFTAVIRCTSAGAVDNKTISKWARALRYVAHCRVPPTRLKTFMKEAGGVNACADLYARYFP